MIRFSLLTNFLFDPLNEVGVQGYLRFRLYDATDSVNLHICGIFVQASSKETGTLDIIFWAHFEALCSHISQVPNLCEYFMEETEEEDGGQPLLGFQTF